METETSTHVAVETWIERAQTGDKVAVQALLAQFEGMLQAISRRYRGLSQADALQEAYLSLLLAIRDYDKSFGVPFAAYAQRKVHGDVRTAMRRWWTHDARLERTDRDKNRPRAWDDGQAALSSDRTANPYSLIEWRLVLPAAGLSERERVVTEAMASGWRIKELAQALGVSAETVKTVRKRALRKLREHLRPGDGH
ncbi:sigma-70 family RNA polymerase sigma factor [Alicyclobacillus kakegawensis]|uniref:sigma-70 family RNA polymerase sigma factor n=1 Tax=Alicyclobacillus kakegawensis TaxID=392012 RepID=UPI000835C4D6|nr:sigma-70 family RNA polymerase sigma factor [Alicyclobacillus kakegawensis]